MNKYEQKGISILNRVILGFKWMLSFILIVISVAFGIRMIVFLFETDSLSKAIEFNPILVVGLPLSALISLSLVLSLEQEAQKIKFKAIGFEFEGAAGQIILWVICFVSIALTMKLFS